MDKDVVHIHSEILLSHKKGGELVIFNNMDGFRRDNAK